MTEPVYQIYEGDDGLDERCRMAIGPGNGVCPVCRGEGQVEYRGASHAGYDDPNYWDACGYCGGDGLDAPVVTVAVRDGDDLPEGFHWATQAELDELYANPQP